MALLFMDSFDHYATVDLVEKWSSIYTAGGSVSPVITAGAGRRASAGLRQAAGNSDCRAFGKVVPAVGNTCVCGFSFTQSAGSFTQLQVNTSFDPNTSKTSSGGTSLALIRQASANQLVLRPNTNGTLSVYRGTTLLGAPSALALAAGVTYYIELVAVIDPTVGTVDVLVNGVSWIALTNQNTRATASSTWDEVVLGKLVSTATPNTWDFDDVYLLDGSGPAPWNGPLGDVRVDARFPTAEGASSAWTPSTGSDNALTVDEAAPNDDTDHNTTATVGATDTFVMQDAPLPGATIYGVQHCLALKKMDAGVCTVAPVIRHGGVDYPGANFSPSTSYAYGLQIVQTNPGTGAAWIEADFNAAEFGYRKTS